MLVPMSEVKTSHKLIESCHVQEKARTSEDTEPFDTGGSTCSVSQSRSDVALVNEILPVAATWLDPEIVIVREVSQKREKQVPYDVTCMWDLKSDTKELIYETDSQTQKTNF